MNRKEKQSPNFKDQNEQTNFIQPIAPKFNPNWAQNLRFDRIIVNLSDCSYQIVNKVVKQLKWKIQTDQNNAQWDIWWTDWHVLPQTLTKMEHHQKINHFPGMYVLSRKNLLAKNLMKMRKKNADQYNFFPLTWNLPGEYYQFKNYFQTKPKGKARTYIVKPESMSQGKGIFLTRKLQEINPTQHCVVQRYLSKPYLIDGLKFDLRIYVLVAGVDPLRVFVFNEGLARFATEAYVGPNKDNMQDICMHLTNYAINKESDKFVFNSDQKNMNVGHKRSLTSAYKTLQENGVNIELLKQKINQMIVKTMISGLSHLKFQYRSCQSQNYRSDMCFQILGFDVILNQNGDPFILQINYTPSFSTDTPLDVHIKKNLIKDTLTIMQVSKQIKQKTVKYRQQCKNIRMTTGKKNKLTLQQKQLKRTQAQQQRNEYIAKNQGGFTQIFPLNQDSPQMNIYNELIKMETEGANGDFRKNKKQVSSVNSISISNNGRASQKLSKLPAISTSNENTMRKLSASKIKSVKRISQSMKTNTENNLLKSKDKLQKLEKQQLDQILQQNSQKFIKRLKLRQIYPKKRTTIVRQTLVPKSIQFQGNRFDGLSDVYKQGIAFGNRNQ